MIVYLTSTIHDIPFSVYRTADADPTPPVAMDPALYKAVGDPRIEDTALGRVSSHSQVLVVYAWSARGCSSDPMVSGLSQGVGGM